MSSIVELKGHPINVIDVSIADIDQYPNGIDDLYTQKSSALIIRQALPKDYVTHAVQQLQSDHCHSLWQSPNQGMPGGEIRTIGAAATPTFTSFTGPTFEQYLTSVQQHLAYEKLIFGTQTPTCTQKLSHIFSTLFHQYPANPPQLHQVSLDTPHTWLPFNYRALDPGIQIYTHHDQHYKLPIYEHMPQQYDRTNILSWFVTLQPADIAGKLTLYGLWGSDPNIPMLPTRFIDTQALEKEYLKQALVLDAGDLLIFDSGHHVHRVTPVAGIQSRLTMGGFMTLNHDRNQLAFWS